MKIICQSCYQVLPKTAVMCPNCGGRTFVPENSFSQAPSPASMNTTASNPPPVTPPPTPMAEPTQTPVYAQPNYNQPQTAYQAEPTYEASPHPSYNNSAYANPNTNQSYDDAGYATNNANTASPAYPSYDPAPQANNYSTYPTYPTQATPLPPALYGKGSNKQAHTMLYAGFFKRGFAFVFDVVLMGLLLALGYQLGLPAIEQQWNFKPLNDQTLALIGFGIYLFYMTFLTCFARQATIGKVIMGLWVFGMQGQRVNFFHALIRETLKLILLPFAFMMWFTARKQTLHDLIARTVVLYDPN
ncbi:MULTISPECIES: RDD family protein [unclassified Moraxella]|uniref:RDD family protein n=1 Tax=unclassified Moraxella TaxID=2685852 RepID=UPI003AF88E94